MCACQLFVITLNAYNESTMPGLCMLLLYAHPGATVDFNGRFNRPVTFLVFAMCIDVRRVFCVCVCHCEMKFWDRLYLYKTKTQHANEQLHCNFVFVCASIILGTRFDTATWDLSLSVLVFFFC